MQIMLWIVAAVFILISIPMFMGRQSFFGKSNESGYDIKKASVVSGIFCVLVAVVSGIAAYFDDMDITRALMIVLCLLIIALIIFVEKKCKK